MDDFMERLPSLRANENKVGGLLSLMQIACQRGGSHPRATIWRHLLSQLLIHVLVV